MRGFLRLVVLFMVAFAVLGGAYGIGYGTGSRLVGTQAIDLPEVLASRVPQPLARSLKQAPPATSGATTTDNAPGGGGDHFQAFWDAWREVNGRYVGDLPPGEDLTYGAIRGSLRTLGDPYTLFTDPVANEVRRVELEGEFEGIGAFVTQNADGQLVIQTPMRGQPAEKAGVEAGDIVLAVDGTEISGLDVNEAVLLIRGPKGTEVVLTIARDGVAEPFDIAVTRDRIDIPSVASARLLEDVGAPEVGYLELTVFASETRNELVREIETLKDAGAQALILDLRNNPGGFLNAAVGVASEFLDEGVVTYREDNRGTRRAESVNRGGSALDLPLVVLVNRGSASASEIVAGAIRDHGRGVIVGETTFGKGSVQNVHELSDGSQLRVTVEIWRTPNGSSIHRRGIEPDVIVTPEPEPVAADQDGLSGDEGDNTGDGETAAAAGSSENDRTGEDEPEGEGSDNDLQDSESEREDAEDVQLSRAIAEAKALLAR